MKEVIILEVSESKESQLAQGFLKQKKIDYRVLAETKLENAPYQKNIFTNYDQVIKNQEREKELKLWDNTDLDEQLNQDGEWWS